MYNKYKLQVRTASPEQSVWRDAVEEKFRLKLVDLEKVSKEVPRDPKVYSQAEWSAHGSRIDEKSRLIPFGVEQQLADDLAFIAAAEEGVNAVSAVGLEELTEQPGIIVRLAANETVRKDVQETLEMIFRLLEHCASRTLARELCAQQVFEQVMNLSRTRIHGRLKSVHWKKPAYYHSDPEPLHLELKKFSRWLRKQYKKSPLKGAALDQQLDSLCIAYEHIDRLKKDTEEELKYLKNIVLESHAVCTSKGSCTIEEAVSSYGYDPKQVCTNKIIRQVDKIGRYWGSCYLMAEASRKYKDRFMSMRLQILPPYNEITSPISFKAGAVSCHVHAEIQLATFYGLKPNRSSSTPRILGVSKSACYLCDLFLKIHGQFFITKTHGRLHDQWTVPDLAEFSLSQRSDYRQILVQMSKEFELEIAKSRLSKPRKYPQGSWLSLPTVLPMSLATSNAGTIVPEISEHTTVTPQIPSIAATPRQSSPLKYSTTKSKQKPEIAVPILKNSTLPPSLGLVQCQKLPICREISANAPFYVTGGKLSLGIEVEGPGQHEIIVENIKEGRKTGHVIDVREMIPGKEILVRRTNPDERVVLTLLYGINSVLQVIL